VDEGRKLAYDALAARLDQQNNTVTELRNRATWLLTAAALIASFSSGLGLVSASTNRQSFPHWASYSLLACVTLIGALTVCISWPIREFGYGPNGEVILDSIIGGTAVDDVLQNVSRLLIEKRGTNNKSIELRLGIFRIASVMLIAEVVVFLLVLVVH